MGAAFMVLNGFLGPFFLPLTFVSNSPNSARPRPDAIKFVIALTVLLSIVTGLDIVQLGMGGWGDAGSTGVLRYLIVQGGFVIVGCAFIASEAACRKRHTRLLRLAAWPSNDCRSHGAVEQENLDGAGSLTSILAHAAEIMEAPRILVVWDFDDSPTRQFAVWNRGELHGSCERVGGSAPLVARTHQEAVFAVARGAGSLMGPSPQGLDLIDRSFRDAFQIRSAATAPFRGRSSAGRVFVMDRPSWTAEDLQLTEIVAAHVAGELDQHSARTKIRADAARLERTRLAHDLHDGVLQGLAAADIRLKLGMTNLPSKQREQFEHVRRIVANESDRIRTLVQETRSSPAMKNEAIELSAHLVEAVAVLRHQWCCEIELDVRPRNLSTRLPVAWNIQHLLTEAVSNAIRHGGASKVSVEVRSSREALLLRIRDSGKGFGNRAGTLDVRELAKQGAAPLSICSRVHEMGGSLLIASSGMGAEMRIEVPR